jgi:putative heme-binding domain-containing protein
MSKPRFFLLSLFSIAICTISCNSGKEKQASTDTTSTKISKDPKVARLKLPAGFNADHLYGPSEHDEGSWVAMTFDNKGRLIASDQYGALYRMTIPPVGDSVTKIKVERLNIPNAKGVVDTSKKDVSIGYAHGLLYAFNSLYVMINHVKDSTFAKNSGLYRLQDTDGDDEYDKITLLKELDGDGEHGPHSIVLSPDKKSLYVVAGNFTKMPKMNSYRSRPSGKLDNIFPFIKDPNGHDNSVNWEGGWIAHVDSTGSNWELISSGFRNPFDIAFNDAGDLFTYDSDMEWDFGTPWYRPTRICHVTSGSEFGWRPGTEKWSPLYTDNLPPVINVGQGSPTNLIYGSNARFPEKYRRSLFAFDWSFGIIYAVYPEQDGATYKATGEEFVSGSPLPLTDGAIGPDGALYFLTGGRRLESDLYRVYYADNTQNTQALPTPGLNEAQKIRRQLEEFHGKAKPGAVDFAWTYLKSTDRFVRFAARVAIENQPVKTWQDKLFREKDPVSITQASIALARKGNADVKNKLLGLLTQVNYTALSAEQQMDLLRAFELVFARWGKPDGAVKTAVTGYLDQRYPAATNELNRELSKLLVYLDAPQAVEKTMALMVSAKDDAPAQKNITESTDLIMRNPQYGGDIAGMLSKVPPQQQTWLAVVLTQAKSGWNTDLQDKYFQWFYHALAFKGGHSFIGFINLARKEALRNVPVNEFARYNKMSGDSLVESSGIYTVDNVIQPKGPGRDWRLDEAVKAADSFMVNRDFEKGKAMFAASLCISCHTMRGEGGTAGPDLTQLGTRFSYKDMLESIIDPSKTISDQFGATVFYMKEGNTVVGRIISQDNDKYVISQNPFAPQMTRDIFKKDIVRTRVSDVSPMLPGLINRLSPEELRDLLAYLKSGGNKQDGIFLPQKK